MENLGLDISIGFLTGGLALDIALWLMISNKQKKEVIRAKIHVGKVVTNLTPRVAGEERRNVENDNKSLLQLGDRLIAELEHLGIALILRIQNLIWKVRFAKLASSMAIILVILIVYTYWLVSNSSDSALIFVYASLLGSIALLVGNFFLAHWIIGIRIIGACITLGKQREE